MSIQKPKGALSPQAQAVQVMKQCPVCDTAYAPEQFVLLSQQGDARLMHATCAHCQYAVLVLVVSTRKGISSVGMITELTASDVERFRDRTPIGETEMFALHTELQKHSQTFIHSVL